MQVALVVVAGVELDVGEAGAGGLRANGEATGIGPLAGLSRTMRRW